MVSITSKYNEGDVVYIVTNTYNINKCQVARVFTGSPYCPDPVCYNLVLTRDGKLFKHVAEAQVFTFLEVKAKVLAALTKQVTAVTNLVESDVS